MLKPVTDELAAIYIFTSAMSHQLREHIEKIIPLSDEEFDFVNAHFIKKSFKKKELMVETDEYVLYNYYLLSGLTKLVYTDQDAKDHILAFAMEDWWDNDFQAYYTQTKATFSMECLEDTEALCLSIENYHALCKALPKIEHFFLEKVTRGFLAAQRRILSLLTTNTEERYRQLLKQHPRLLQRVPKTQLAAYLGVSREGLSRIIL